MWDSDTPHYLGFRAAPVCCYVQNVSRDARKPIIECGRYSEINYQNCHHKNIKQIEANTTIKIQLSTRTIILKQTVYDFDLNQHKTNFDDWNKAFEN